MCKTGCANQVQRACVQRWAAPTDLLPGADSAARLRALPYCLSATKTLRQIRRLTALRGLCGALEGAGVGVVLLDVRQPVLDAVDLSNMSRTTFDYMSYKITKIQNLTFIKS